MKKLFDRNVYTEGNDVRLLRSGPEYFSRLRELLLSAQHFIHIQVYIFDEDETGRSIIALLLEAASRGVNIYIVVDGYASGRLSTQCIRDFKKAGIVFKRFSPIKPSFRFRIGSRLHHKIVLVDGDTALLGGINIANKYEGSPDAEPWLDFAVETHGRINRVILRVCENMWNRRIKKRFRSGYGMIPVFNAKAGTKRIRLLQNDWFRRHIEISSAYRKQIRTAEKSITIIASYFLPGFTFRKLLRKAAERGVKVRLMLSGQSDVLLARLSANYLYPYLLRNHIEIYEWDRSVLHGKLLVKDDEWCTIGSYNINAISDYASLELNVAVDDKEFSACVREMVDDLFTTCRRIDPEHYRVKLQWLNMLVHWIGYQVTRILFAILFMVLRGRRKRVMNDQ
jgi:cardiolipin synthase